MIKIISAKVLSDSAISLIFSDGCSGDYDLSALIQRSGAMVQPLKDADYFRRVFIEEGALCWPNGFDLSPSAIYRELETTGRLVHSSTAA